MVNERDGRLFVRWDDKTENWYRVGWSPNEGSDLILDVDDKRSLSRVYAMSERIPYDYRSESSSSAESKPPTSVIIFAAKQREIYGLESDGTVCTLPDLSAVVGSIEYSAVPDLVFDTPRTHPKLQPSFTTNTSSSWTSPQSIVYHKTKCLGHGIILNWNTLSQRHSVFVFWERSGMYIEERVDRLMVNPGVEQSNSANITL
jgi:hypothetical protein